MQTGYEGYKTIRNAIRKFSKRDLLKYLVIQSKKVSQAGPEVWSKGYVPWEILLLSRWVILDWNSISGKLPATTNQINALINRLKSFLDTDEPLLTSGSRHGLNKFMRRMAFQQFWHQQAVDHSKVGRTIELLIKPVFSEKIDRSLREKYGVSRKTMFDVLLMLWVTFDEKEVTHINQSFFKGISSDKLRLQCELFLRNFSLSEKDFEEFNINNPPRNYYLEVFEKPPLTKKPLLRMDNEYYLWSFSFLNDLLENGLYDHLKLANSEVFGDEFGPIFERYIEKRLNNYNLPFIKEHELKKLGAPKQVDFALKGGLGRLLIEAKAIEASRHARLNSTDEILTNAYKKDIVKALAQAHTYIEWTQITEPELPTYLLVVTYKELFLGNAENTWDEFIEQSIRDHYKIESFKLAPENIFFLSIGAFDQLLGHCENSV